MCKKNLLKAVRVIFLILILPSNILAKVFSPAARKKVAPLIIFLFCLMSILSVSICLAATPAPEVTHCRLDIVADPVASRGSGLMDISATPGRD